MCIRDRVYKGEIFDFSQVGQEKQDDSPAPVSYTHLDVYKRQVLRSARISAQKVRLVADQVRGLPVARALDLLKFSDKKAAVMIYKVVFSAASNAENNNGADADTLKVKTIMVDEGPSLKRFMARAKGCLLYTSRCV